MTGFVGILRFTVLSLWRERWPWAVLPLLALGCLVARVLASFTIGRDAAVTLDLGLVYINLTALLCTLYMAHLNWSREMESPSAAFLLTRPLSRMVYVLGRFVGMAAMMAFVVFAGAITLMVVGRLLGVPFNGQVLVAAYGIFLGLLVLLAFATLSGQLSSPVLGLMVSVIFYITTLLADSAVDFFFSRQAMAQRLGQPDAHAGFYKFMGRVMEIFVPQLGRLNFKNQVILEGAATLPVIPFFHLTVYALTFVAVFLAWGLWVFEKKEFP